MSNDAWRPKHNPWLIAITVTLATFMEVLDTSIANVSLPHIAGNLSAGLDESTWILTSYLVANAVVLPLSAWFASFIGRKNYYMLSVALFTISSFLCGFAPNLFWLVTFRVMQGLGGGGLQPSEQSILADTFPKEKLGMAMAMYGVAVVTAPILGPTLGGWITDNFSWRWIFFINIPVGLISIFLTLRFVEDPPHLERRARRTSHIDYVGVGAITLGIAALQIMLDKGQRLDWFESNWIVLMALVSVAAFVFFVFWELYHKDPVIDVRMLKERNFVTTNLLMFVLGFVLFGSTVLLPLFLQTLMGYPATTAGLVLSPGGLLTMATMPFVGLLLMKYDPRWLIAFGLCVVGASLLRMSHFNLYIDYRTALLARVVQSGGLGFLFIPINTAAYAFIRPHRRSQASGLMNFARNIGGSVGIAFAATMLARHAQMYQSVLASNMTATSPAFQESLHRMTQGLIFHGVAPGQAGGMAQGIAYRDLIRQSTMLAYLTDFRIMAYICFGTLLLLFLLKKSGHPKTGGLAVH